MSLLRGTVETFKSYLLANCPERHKAFSDLERSKPESARAMAGLFSMFKSQGFEVTIYEDPSTGGADLLCKKREDPFLVEITSLEVDTVSARSGLESGAESGWSGPITHLLRNRASEKGTCTHFPGCKVFSMPFSRSACLSQYISSGSILTLTRKILIVLPRPSILSPFHLPVSQQQKVLFR